jgi:xylulokinase
VPVTVLALDLGTTMLKAALYVDGQPQSVRRLRVETRHLLQGWAEQDPRQWLQTLVDAVATLDLTAVQPDAIGLSAQSDTLVLATEAGEPVRPAMLWMDVRGADEAAGAEHALSRRAIHQTTGLRAAFNFTAPKAGWVRRHDPESFALARWIMQPKDYLFAWLTGEARTDPSSATRTLAFDQEADRWWQPMLAELDLPIELLPPVAADSREARPLRPTAAQALGLPAGIPVIVGAADRAAEALAAGVGGRRALLTSGTASAVVAALPRSGIAASSLGLDDRLITPRHARSDERLVLGSIPTTGAALEWLAKVSASGPDAVDALLDEAATAPPGSNGVLCVPSFDGARSIRWQPEAMGAVVGLSLSSTRADLVRSVIEGIGLEVRAILTSMDRHGVRIEELVLSGGLHRNAFVSQTMADITGLPAYVSDDPDAALTGAMLLADPTAATPTPSSRLEPHGARRDLYAQLVDRHEAATEAVLGLKR